jgi:hypothetical protein
LVLSVIPGLSLQVAFLGNGDKDSSAGTTCLALLR